MDSSNSAADRAALKVTSNRLYVQYEGQPAAFLQAGILKADWLNNIGKGTRRVAINPDGSVTISDGGKGNWLSGQQRRLGAFSIRQNWDGSLHVTAYRSPEEAREYLRDALQEDSIRQGQADWANASAALTNDQGAYWRTQVLAKVDEIAGLICGKLVFQGIPEFALPGNATDAAAVALSELKRVISGATPCLKVAERVEPTSNVVALRARAFRSVGNDRQR